MKRDLNLQTVWNRANARQHQQLSEKDAATVERINTLIATARGSWFALLSYLAFAFVTLMGIEDADFFIKERQTQLPLIGVEVPTSLFYYIAPGLGMMLYVHMHFYLLKLWKAVGEAPDQIGNKPLGEHIRAWIVADLALRFKGHGAQHAYRMQRLVQAVAFASIFLAAPAVLFAFWLWSMPKHDLLLTLVFCGVPFWVSLFAMQQSWIAIRRRPRKLHAKHLTGLTLYLSMVAVASLSFGKTYEPLSAWLPDQDPKPDWYEVWPLTLASADLEGVDFSQISDSLPDRETSQRLFRQKWCKELAIPTDACGLGPMANDGAFEPTYRSARWLTWCQEMFGKSTQEDTCEEHQRDFDAAYKDAWETHRNSEISTLKRYNLERQDFRNANLVKARMEGADLSEARMEGADLSDARMQGAILFEARMQGANLFEARMEGADLSGARMERADLFRARMQGAILFEARMQGAILFEARMQGADLSEARMQGADLSEARMQGANLSEARMQGAILFRARMQGADLRWARMEGVDLFDARMQGADVRGARFDKNTSFQRTTLQAARWKDVTLTKTDLAQSQVNASFGDGSVTLPDGLILPEHWPAEDIGWDAYHEAYDAWLKTHSP